MTSKPQYVFRIDEIHETNEGEVIPDHRSRWVPSVDTKGHALGNDGASGRWWFCDGQTIRAIRDTPANSVHYQTTTMYFNGGFGFWVSRGDATRTEPNWQPLEFEHSETDWSSYLTNAGEQSQLKCIQGGQTWPRMLLPDIYHGEYTPHAHLGGLKGDISILWALIAFSMHPSYLTSLIPQMFQNGVWQTHNSRHGRKHQRGVIVWIYTCQDTASGPSNAAQLYNYEQGQYGLYYK